MAQALGAQAVEPFVQTGMGAEDFSYFVEPKHGIKGYYFAVGGTPPAAFEPRRMAVRPCPPTIRRCSRSIPSPPSGSVPRR
jgi:hippurate hydrolase